MFRPAKIYHTTIILKEEKVNTLINKLYELGLCQLKESEIDLSSKYSYELVKNLESMQDRFNFIMESLEKHKEAGKKPLLPKKHKSMLFSTKEIIEEVEYHLNLIEPKILKKLEELQKIDEQIQQNKFVMSNLSLVPDIQTNILKSSDDIKVLTGLVTKRSLTKIKEGLSEKAVIAAEEKEKDQSFITIFTTPENLSEAERVLHTLGFQALDVPYDNKTPTQIMQNLRKDINKLENEKNKANAFLAKTQKVYEKKFDLLSEELEIAKQKILALQNFKTTKAFSVLEAWVPAKKFKEFYEIVKQTSKQHYIEIDEKDDAPTLFQNPKLIEPFEMITELYSPPKYKDFDPTPLLAFTFALFFGFMLTDVAYGIIILTLGWIMYKKMGKSNEGMKKFAILLIIFGIFTTIIGAVFGSYFGNFFQEIGIKLPVPIDAMKQIMLALSIALALGAFHLIMGLVTGFYENMHKGSFKNAMSSQGVWLIFMVGAGMFLLKLNTIGLIMVLIAIILHMVFSFFEGDLVTSLLSVFDFSGFVGDLFSYARLMALAIGTAGIALAVNFMVFMAVDLIPFIGIPIAVVVFIVGHAFNMAMNGLGSFIHTTRLHFLEFFTKFYDGGGKSYKPFLAQRKNTFVKLEGGS